MLLPDLEKIINSELTTKINSSKIVHNQLDISIDQEEGWVKIVHTLTSAFCPEADTIVQSINNAVAKIDGVNFCDVETTFDPPFTIDKVPEATKLMMGWG